MIQTITPASEGLACLETYFDKIYVISLRRATDRQRDVERLLNGLPYEFFWAVDKQHLDRDELIRNGVYDDVAARRPQFRHRHGMGLGQIACSLSHRLLHETIVREGYERVLIFEDDVVPVEAHLSQVRQALAELPADWELLYLGYRKHETVTSLMRMKQQLYKVLSPLGLVRWTSREARHFLPRPYSARLRRAGLHDCTHAYALSRAGAQQLLAAHQPIVAHIDSFISYQVLNGQLNAFVSVPSFFDQVGDSYAN